MDQDQIRVCIDYITEVRLAVICASRVGWDATEAAVHARDQLLTDRLEKTLHDFYQLMAVAQKLCSQPPPQTRTRGSNRRVIRQIGGNFGLAKGELNAAQKAADVVKEMLQAFPLAHPRFADGGLFALRPDQCLVQAWFHLDVAYQRLDSAMSHCLHAAKIMK